MTTEGEIDRALASITATLNDQRPEALDPSRLQRIVNDALGAPQESTSVYISPSGPDRAYVLDGQRRVAEISRADGGWQASKTS